MQRHQHHRLQLHAISSARQEPPGPPLAPAGGPRRDHHPGADHRHLREAQEA